MLIRIFFYLIITFSLLWLPWWVFSSALLAGLIFSTKFFEGIFFAFIADLIYGSSIFDIIILNKIFFTVVTAALLILLEIFIKKRIRGYEEHV